MICLQEPFRFGKEGTCLRAIPGKVTDSASDAIEVDWKPSPSGSVHDADMSLRARILLLVLLAILAPAVMFSVYELRQRDDKIDEAKRNLNSLAKYAAENLDDKVKGTVQLLHGLSRAPDLDTTDKAACSEFLAGVLGRYPQYTGLLTITPDGDLHCDSLRSGRKLNLSGRDYFRQVRATLEPAFEVVFGGLTGIAVLQVAYPVLDGRGSLKYVLLSSLNLSEYAQGFAAASQYSSIRILIWNRKGMLMARKPDARDGGFVGKEFAASELFRFAASGQAGTAAELPDLDGARTVWALGVMPEPRGGGARITLGIPHDVLVAAANQGLRDALALLFGVSLLAFAGAWYVAETGIRRQVRRIARVAKRIGTGDLGAPSDAPYPRGELGELMAVVDRTAEAVQAQRAEIESRSRDLQHVNRTLRVLSSINALLVRVRDRDELFREACRIAVEEGGFRMSLLCIVDRSAMNIVPVASAGKDEELQAAIKGVLSSSEGAPNTMVARAIGEKKALVSNDSQNDPRVVFGKKYAESGVRSMAIFPLIVSDEAVGALALYASESEFFHEEEIKLLTGLTGDIAFALEHIGKEEKIARLTRIQAVMSGISTLIVRVRDRDELFREACRVAVEHGQFRMAWIGVVDRSAMKIVPVASAGAEPEFLTLVKDRFSLREDASMGNTMSARAVREKKAIVSNEIRDDSKVLFAKERIERGISSMAILPLLVSDDAVGVLALYADETGFFDEEEMKLLTGLAGDIAFALENIGRQQKLGKLARIRAISSQINAAIVRVRERKALLEETCRIVSEHGKFELIWIGAIDHDALQVQPMAWKGFSEDAARAVSWASIGAAKGTLGEAIQTRKASVRNDIEGELPGGKLRHEALKLGCRSSVCLPLVVDDKVAALIVLFAPGAGFFDEEELALLNEVAADVSFALQAIEKQKKLDYLSYYDVLTGLANRSLFLERVAQYMRSAVSGGHKLAVGLIDLERFKNINDSLGRPAGDALLRHVAEWLTRRTGDASVLARVGADHFAVVLPEVKQGGNLAGLIDGLMAALLEHPFRLNDAVFRVTLKMGVALFPDDGADADTLFRNAEAALKKTKARGDRYLFYTRAMTETVAVKLTLENQLRQALDKEEFVLHYQPKVSLVSGKLTGAEALIRWNDPRTGLVPPGRFIPVLEETGLIFEVGRWALRRAIEDYLRWRAAGLPAVRIAVNVSPLQLRNRGLIAEIEQVIGIDAHAPAGLELEITESLIMDDVKHNIASLQAIRAMGVTIAIDDFGTGFSSLAYLAKLPVDTLKIDRSFVIDMTAGAEGLALVSTIITLAHSLKLKAVAEGVETEEQSRLLRSLDCDEMQGFLFSKPVPSEVLETRYLAQPLAAAEAA